MEISAVCGGVTTVTCGSGDGDLCCPLASVQRVTTVPVGLGMETIADIKATHALVTMP